MLFLNLFHTEFSKSDDLISREVKLQWSLPYPLYPYRILQANPLSYIQILAQFFNVHALYIICFSFDFFPSTSLWFKTLKALLNAQLILSLSRFFKFQSARNPSIIRRLLRKRLSTYSRNAAQFFHSLSGDLFIVLILYSILQADGTDFCFRKKHAI